MKIIQTTINCIDFQSRIIHVNMTWNDFVEYVLTHIKDGISDEELPMTTSYPFDKGTLIGKSTWYDVNQKDDCHLDLIVNSRNVNFRVCFLLLEEEL